MKRQQTGIYEITSIGDGQVRAFIPNPLPPEDVLDMKYLQHSLDSAIFALGQLGSIATILPEPWLYIYAYIRREAVLSSRIEGMQSTLSDLMLFELTQVPGVRVDDVVEVSNYVSALEHGLRRIREDYFPLCNRLIREIHKELLSSDRENKNLPGEFRRSQNWLGGTRPGNARFVPPPTKFVEKCMSDLERFMYSDDRGHSALIRTGLSHVQFETIHPFLDGNGRVGRLLIALQLCHEGLLNEPLLYLSLHFKKNRSDYYLLLDAVRHHGDWEAWLRFFLEGITETSENAISVAKRLNALFVTTRYEFVISRVSSRQLCLFSKRFKSVRFQLLEVLLLKLVFRFLQLRMACLHLNGLELLVKLQTKNETVFIHMISTSQF